MPVVNLATNYSADVESAFTSASFLKSLSLDDSNINFDGARHFVLQSMNTVPLTEYRRSGTSRYGEADEIGNTQQDFYLKYDMAYTGIIDKGNASDNASIKKAAARWLKQEVDEQVVPFFDTIALKEWSKNAGIKATVSTPTKETVFDMICDAAAAMSENHVPVQNRYLLVPSTLYYSAVRFLIDKGSDKMATDAMMNGYVGTLLSFKVIEIPSSYFPTGVEFVAAHKESIIYSHKIADGKCHTDPPGISGMLYEGRDYGDAFVRGVKANGVYVACASAALQAAPTISLNGAAATVSASSGAGSTLYTTDGSDPRYSVTAKVYSSAVTLEHGQTIKACCLADNKLTSAIAEKTYA